MKILAWLRLDVLTVLSAALLTLASPVFGLSFLVWIALVPFLAAIERQGSWRGALAQGLWLSLLMTAGVYHWLPPAITEFHAMSGWIPWLFFPLYGLLAQPQFLAYALVRWAWRGRHDLATALASALLYTGLDWLAPKVFVDTLGQAFYADRLLIQVIDLGGVFLLTLLLVLVNEAVHAALAHRLRRAPRASRAFMGPLRSRLVLAGVLVAATLGYGAFRGAAVQRAQDRAKEHVRAALIQANVGNFDKVAAKQGDMQAVVDVLTRYGRLSDAEATGPRPPDLLVWPETAYPLAYGADRSPVDSDIDAELRTYTRERQIPLLFGGFHVADGREYNSALVVDPAGALQVYHKNILLPFGEYLPLVDDWTWLRERLSRIPKFGTGGTELVLEVPLADGRTVRVAPIICYEALFTHHLIRSANAGSQVIVNLTNDSWFRSTAQKRLHLAMSTLRSVETHQPQLRATNTGISALIGPDGQIVDAGPVDAEASLSYRVPLVDLPPTVVMRAGAWAGPASLAAGVLLALVLALRRRARS